MKGRPLQDRTSWTFFAAIHGIRRWMWDLYGFTNASDAAPGALDTAEYLNQCQHQSWYFLPWHRGFLLAVENILRNEIKLLSGPHESWALPYWNYFASGQNSLPPAFRTADWPDGQGDNPLFVEQRWGPLSSAAAFDIASATNLEAMNDPAFSGPGNGGSVGFGGPKTGFSWSGIESGGIESDPHNIVHGLVGGRNQAAVFPPGTPFEGNFQHGVMSDPLAAALDPIFYLHHCNLDRLWESWNAFPSGKSSSDPNDWHNPTDPRWLDGPARSGERAFAMPNPDESKWAYTPNEMRDLASLGYEYDDLTPGEFTPAVTVAARMRNLHIAVGPSVATGGLTMPSQNRVEMIGASPGGFSLAGTDAVRSTIRTEPEARARVSKSLQGLSSTSSTPDRVFLNLESVTGLSDAVMFRVYVGSAGGADPVGNTDFLAGSVALFGVSQASDPNGRHAGNGITYTLEITRIIDKLHLSNTFEVDDLAVYLVPFETIPDVAKVKIGRISVYRQFE
jgi:tyrosinase